MMDAMIQLQLVLLLLGSQLPCERAHTHLHIKSCASLYRCTCEASTIVLYFATSCTKRLLLSVLGMTQCLVEKIHVITKHADRYIVMRSPVFCQQCFATLHWPFTGIDIMIIQPLQQRDLQSTFVSFGGIYWRFHLKEQNSTQYINCLLLSKMACISMHVWLLTFDGLSVTATPSLLSGNLA